MRYLLFLLFILPFISGAQVFIRPDYASIEKAVNDKKSPYYHPELLARFRANDTSLTSLEYKYLYYGTYFVDMSPDDIKRKKAESARTERKILMEKDSATDTDLQQIIKLTDDILAANPLNLGELGLKLRLFARLNDTLNTEIYVRKLKGIVQNIKTTGDGTTCSTAYHIATIADEYYILRLLKYEFVSQSLTADDCDYLEVKPNKDYVQGVYFDVKQMMANMKKMLEPGLSESINKMIKDEKKSKKH